MSIASEVEEIIRHTRLLGLEESVRGEGVIEPHYCAFSIANLPATVAGLLGRELDRAEPPLPRRIWGELAGDARRVVVVILDAVGYQQFRRLLDLEENAFGRLARDGCLVPLTSVFPSTTMAAMSSFWTGRTPGAHGFLGRRLFLPELGVLADMIRLTPDRDDQPGALLEWGWEPEEFLPVPNLAEMLAAQGVMTVAHLLGSFTGSGLARLFLRSVSSVRGYVNYSDMWINVRDTLVQGGKERLYVNVYWSGTDDVAHTYGPDDQRMMAALRGMARSLDHDFLRLLPLAAREGTVLIITADHGQIGTPPERAVHLSDHPTLRQMLLLPPTGEPRASWLHIRAGQAESVRAYVTEHLADRFLLMEMDQVVAAGLFGQVEILPESRVRLGDMLLLARNDSRLILEGQKATARGEHGGLKQEEMLVPLWMVRLDG